MVQLAIDVDDARWERMRRDLADTEVCKLAFAEWLIRELKAHPLELPELRDASVPLGDHTWAR